MIFFILSINILHAKDIDINLKTPTSDKIVKFHIDDKVYNKQNQLIKLILNTESMDDEERQYWFDIMPSMSDEQIKRLFDILETERKKLEELELKYQNEIKTLNEKHLIEWQEFQIKDTLKKLDKEEKNTLLLFVENPNKNKNIMPFTLAFSNDFDNIEKILVKNNFDRFDISKSKKYIDSMLFNYFVNFIIEKDNFKKYYDLYGIDIFDILEVYYQNLSYTNDLRESHIDILKKLNVSKDKEHQEKYQQLIDYVERIFILNLPARNADEVLSYLNKNLFKINNKIFTLYHSLYANEYDENAISFIQKSFEFIKKDNFKYLENYKARINKNLESELIIVSLVLQKYSHIIDKTTSKRMYDFINELKNNSENFKNDHYFEMTNLFLSKSNNLSIDNKIKSLNNEYTKNKTNQELEANLLEYAAYNALHKAIAKQNFDLNLPILQSIKNNIVSLSKASGYLELKFIDYLKKLKEQNEREALKAEFEKSKKDGAVKQAIIDIAVNFIIVAIIVYALLQAIFASLILGKNLPCEVSNILLISPKGAGIFAEWLLRYKLKKFLFDRVSKKITDESVKHNIDMQRFSKHNCTYDYNNENEKYLIARQLSKHFGLLPITLLRDIDLRIGCVDDLLFHRDYSKYLFILDTNHFQSQRDTDLLVHNISEKYIHAKIIIFSQIAQSKESLK